ncbi:hypothetical protein KC19_6G220600 [Ceratodon purpureus]|uniref:Coenzyme F420 hydrogenase/dehydrogenase beta subunit N-terminal domain-containing protein n=1 Tax=Ceratodon purpureus TaxID=3225 RepID=A0A8T0HKC0_CERPU|nr:hypothetical protein KC19_6G220600 [Ceratodon purpureus]
MAMAMPMPMPMAVGAAAVAAAPAAAAVWTSPLPSTSSTLGAPAPSFPPSGIKRSVTRKAPRFPSIHHHHHAAVVVVLRASSTGAGAGGASTVDSPSDWRRKAKPIKPGSSYPAKDHCSQCGLCDTYYIAHVKDACAFLGDGMSRVEDLEPKVHGRGRNPESMDDLFFGVHDDMLYARKIEPVEGAQWTGIVTTIAMEMLRSNIVDAVICVQR